MLEWTPVLGGRVQLVKIKNAIRYLAKWSSNSPDWCRAGCPDSNYHFFSLRYAMDAAIDAMDLGSGRTADIATIL